MHIPVFPLSGLARNQQGQATGNQAFKLMHHLLGIFEVMHAAAAGQQLIDRLRAAQEQQSRQHHLSRHQFQCLVDPVLPAIRTAAHHQFGEAACLKGAQALTDLALGQVHHRFTAGLLVAGDHQRIEGKRVGFRAGGLFFDQRAQNTDFRTVESRLVMGRLLLGDHGSASLPGSGFHLRGCTLDWCASMAIVFANYLGCLMRL